MRSESARMVLTMLGTNIMLLPIGVHAYWGNLATYVLSYLHHHDPNVKGSESSWVVSIHLVTRVICLISSGYMMRRLGKRLTSFLGIVVFTLGLGLSYFAVQRSIMIINITIGIACGCGSGILYGSSLEYSLQWNNGNSGLILSIVQSSYNVGAIIANQILTVYINPENKIADLENGNYVFFDQKDILSRVPDVFIILAAGSLGFHLLGFCMVRERRQKQASHIEITTVDDHTPITEIEATGHTSQSVPETLESESLTTDLNLSQIIRTSSFYILWIICFFGELEYLLLFNYYKIFGQLLIRDDRYLSVLGSVSVFVMVASKIVFGHVSDKLSFKTMMIGNFSLMAVSSAWLYLSPRVSRWLYFVNVLVVASPCSILAVATTVGAIRFYGYRNVVVNSGFISTSLAAMELIAPPVMELILSHRGWQWLFSFGAFLSTLSFFEVIIFLPRI